MKHAILGAGGVGGMLAAALARRGRLVTLLVRDRTHPRLIRLQSQVLGDFTAEVEVATTVPARVDVLWLAVKSHQLASAMAGTPPSAVGETQVVPLLNGVEHVERLRQVYGRNRVSPGTIRSELERLEPGSYRQASPFIKVEIAGPRAEALAGELADAGIEASVERDELSMLWKKLMTVGPLALTTSSLQAPVGAVRGSQAWREKLLALVAEFAATGKAEGATLDAEGSRTFLLGVPDQMQSSMQKDRAAGRPLELDAIAGAVQRAGRRHAIPTPVTDELATGLGANPSPT